MHLIWAKDDKIRQNKKCALYLQWQFMIQYVQDDNYTE